MPIFLWLGSTAINVDDIVSWEDVPIGGMIPQEAATTKIPRIVVFLRHSIRRPHLFDTQRERFLAWAKAQQEAQHDEAL